MYFKVNFEVRSGYGGPFLSIPVRSGAFRSIPVSKRTPADLTKMVKILSPIQPTQILVPVSRITYD